MSLIGAFLDCKGKRKSKNTLPWRTQLLELSHFHHLKERLSVKDNWVG
jgi:hypothetical protein